MKFGYRGVAMLDAAQRHIGFDRNLATAVRPACSGETYILHTAFAEGVSEQGVGPEAASATTGSTHRVFGMRSSASDAT